MRKNGMKTSGIEERYRDYYGDGMNAIYSWTAIFMACILCMPLGIYLLIRRERYIKNSEQYANKSFLNDEPGKIAKTTSIVLYTFAVIFVIAGFESGYTGEDYIYIFAFWGFGATLSNVAKKKREEIEILKSCVVLVDHSDVVKIDRIASNIGKTYEETKGYLQKLINKGVFEKAYISESLREIVVEKKIEEIAENQSSANARAVTCKCCGGTTKVNGDAGQCRYCDSPLK